MAKKTKKATKTTKQTKTSKKSPVKKTKSTPSSKAKGKNKDIEAYEAKRDFSKTAEPLPEKKKTEIAKGGVFVVHRHEARRLHYDLRLEAEGVLKCFAIPKGFSYNPSDKFLAVRTEDHPLRYTEFKGMIPKGEYGGGTMLIYDEGTYEIVKADNLPEALNQGEVKVKLWGQKLRGEWHLVQTDKKKDLWLSFKSKDRYVRSITDFQAQIDLSAAKAKAIPKYKFMQPISCAKAFDKQGWFFEMWFSGARAFLRLNQGEPSLILADSKEKVILKSIFNAADLLRAENCVLDGVLVASDDKGRPSKKLLQERLAGDENQKNQIVFYAFDLLYYEEWDVTSLVLKNRKELLLSIISQTPFILYVDHVETNGTTLAEVVAQGGLKGLIGKDSQSKYEQKESDFWQSIEVKAKNTNKDIHSALAKVKKGKNKAASKVEFKNLDKIYWPKQGITKGDLLYYYQQICDVLLPYLYDRPVHMLRYPDGIEGQFFYQKQLKDYTPEWVQTIDVTDVKGKDEAVKYMMLNDRDSLLYCINLGSIDLHPWMSKKGSLKSPDIAFIDLDPKEAPFNYVVRLAKAVGKLLRGIGLRPYVKTSGKTGIHICIPLIEGYTYEQSRMFCEGVARVIVKEYGEIATVERAMGSRGKKVYVDFLQNRREQTIVPPYVVRPVANAQVSTPLEWDELENEIEPSMFTIKNVPERFNRLGDLYRGILDDKQDLLPAIEKLQNYINEL